MSVLYLVRHGQSEWNRIGRIQGRAESPLTGLGREQAAALGRKLREILPNPGIDIVASPLARAFETATIIAAELGRSPGDVQADDRIIDFNVGILSGYPGWDAVAASHPELARLRLEDPMDFQPPGGESGADVLARARGAFLVEREAAGRDTLLVCHGVINKFIRAAARGITGGDIIALGEDQEVVYRLDGATETELRAHRASHGHGHAARETAGGETVGGETTGGETTGGETTGGETAGGETAGGETTGGETAGGETTGGETAGGETTEFSSMAGRETRSP